MIIAGTDMIPGSTIPLSTTHFILNSIYSRMGLLFTVTVTNMIQ